MVVFVFPGKLKKTKLAGTTLRTVFKLSLLPWLLFVALPVCARQAESRADAVTRANAAMAYEERLWVAQKTLEAGNLEEAERLYRLILGEYQDDPRALLGLARVLHKMARRDGRYLPGFEELMNRLKDIVDEQGKGVAAMQSRLRGEATPPQDGLHKSDARSSGAYTSVRAKYRRRTGLFQKGFNRGSRSPVCHKSEGSGGRESFDGNERLLAPLLFRKECPEPSLKNWFFLDPPC